MLLPREQAHHILALRDQGMTVRSIAREVGCAQNTVVGYIHRRTTPGRRASPRRALGDFVDYCRHRFTDDPELATTALFGELVGLGYAGSRSTFYRDLDRYDLLPPPENTQLKPGRCPTTASRSSTIPTRRVRPLPVRVPPITGELLGSYLARLAACNHTSIEELLAILPRWVHAQIPQHQGRAHRDVRLSAVQDALCHLADIAGVSQAALAHALPAFATALHRGQPTGPIRVTTACRRCTATRGIRQPIPVRLPATTHVCIRHGLWLSAPDRLQLDVNACPEIIAAQKRVWRLPHRRTPEQLIFALVAATQQVQANLTPARRHRLHLLQTANPGLAETTAVQEFLLATAYPDILDAWKRGKVSRLDRG